MQRKLVHHHNVIGHEINISLECYADEDEVREYLALNPMTGEKMCKTNTVISYGYSDEENKILQGKLTKDCELFVTDCFTDVLAVPSVYQFVNPLALSKEEMHMLMQYSIEVQEGDNDE